MREMEIERLVQWAYRDELPKRGIGTLANRWDVVTEYGERGGLRIDDEPGFPVIMGMPHPDALTIERAVQGLHDEVALDWRTMRGLLMGDLPLLAPGGNPMLLGATTRRASAVLEGDRRAIHGGADVTTERVFSEVALVETHARSGRRPQWNVGIPSPQRIMGANNRPSVIGQNAGGGRYTHGSHCPLQYTAPTIEQLIIRRFEYLVWRDGLVRLVGTLRGWLLRDHVPVAPNAPAVPWLDAPAPVAAPVDGVAQAWPLTSIALAELAAVREAEAMADDEAVAEAERAKRRNRRNVPTI